MTKKPTIPPQSKKRPKPMNLEGVEIDSKFKKLVKSAAKMGPKSRAPNKAKAS
jgi:hypothetical protein